MTWKRGYLHYLTPWPHRGVVRVPPSPKFSSGGAIPVLNAGSRGVVDQNMKGMESDREGKFILGL